MSLDSCFFVFFNQLIHYLVKNINNNDECTSHVTRTKSVALKLFILSFQQSRNIQNVQFTVANHLDNSPPVHMCHVMTAEKLYDPITLIISLIKSVNETKKRRRKLTASHMSKYLG